MRLALAYEVRPESVPDGPMDLYAEFEQVEAIQMLAETLEGRGHTVFLVDSQNDPTGRLLEMRDDIDLVFNYSVGFGQRSREAILPAVCAALGIPYTGADAMGQCLVANKHATKLCARFAGVPTPRWNLASPASGNLVVGVQRVIVKPAYEGTSIGLSGPFPDGDSGVTEAVCRVWQDYGQPALVEEFIAGREVTVPVLGNDPARALQPLALSLRGSTHIGDAMFTTDLKVDEDDVGLHWSPETGLDAGVVQRMARAAERMHMDLGCRDFSRVDFRIDDSGQPWLLEVNATPQLTPEGGVFVTSAAIEGWTYGDVLEAIVDAAWVRYSQNHTSLNS